MSKYKLVIIAILLFIFGLLTWKAREVDFRKNLKPAISIEQQQF